MKKLLIIIGFFLVTWNEYIPVFQHSADGCPKIEEVFCLGENVYSLEVSTKTIALTTKEDVDRFTKWGTEIIPYGWINYAPPIGTGAFNIKVEEVE